MRTPGRRYFESHWHIRLAGSVAILLLASSVWFLYGRVQMLQRPHNPHFETAHCFDCHEQRGSKMKAEDCFGCHDSRTRELLPGAIEKRLAMSGTPCSHPLITTDPAHGRSVTQLCMRCHEVVNGLVVMTNIATGAYVEFDMTETHPIGTMPTEHVYPKTLPLDKKSGAINCISCHDPHATDRRMRMLRYFYPGNGKPASYSPLCRDCHPDEWIVLRLPLRRH